ncbi:MAG: hypothetical protein ABIS28_03075 [Caldimonas sp.]
MPAYRPLAAVGWCAAWAAGLLATPVVAAPAPGRYDATLCVSSAALAASCGPAEVDVRSSGAVWVQVSDIVYRLRVSTAQSVVVVTQGTMQIDEFDAGAEWSGTSLRFADADKQVRYEVQVGSPRAAPKR